MDFRQLRQKHTQLIYEGFAVLQEDGNLKITFDFLLTPDIRFKPEVLFPNISKERLDQIDPQVLNNLVFNLGLVEMLSYWKAACPPKIVIKAGYLDEEQIKFWKKLLIKGLGEFFYTNKIDFTKDDLVEFVIASKAKQSSNEALLKDRDLVLVGGGKDSAVTLELNSQKGSEFNCLMLNPTEAAIKITEASGCKTPIIIKRIIDPGLLKLNAQGYLNGHTPFSAYLAFLSVVAGVLYDYKNLLVSNESSSNEGNVTWLGRDINHQYSKSLEFEKDFQGYSRKYLASDTNYYSFIRSMGEIEVAEKFFKMEKYHKIFRSCNRGSKEGIWCGECPKCISTYLLLYPFLGEKTNEIFGQDITKKKNFLPIVKGLLRENDQVKPFECVATVEEIRESIKHNPKVLQMINRQASKAKILILGFGREGRATKNYFKKHYPEIEIGITDKNEGADYLDKLKDYPVIIKSPGIPYLPEIKKAQSEGKIILSATQIFFDTFKGQIIGVTGTKGKSTTASLIYEVLKAGNLDVHLIGNIGKPALDLLDELNENSIVVYELSSFMLEDLQKSPHIAVLTNIYPEHLDHHGDFTSYIKAKSNITKFQTNKDYLIYNQDIAKTKDIASLSQAQKIPYSKADVNKVLSLMPAARLPVLGEHNLVNIIPSVLIGRLFNIPDEKITSAILNFKSLPHRLEFVGTFKGIKFYNDSLATIPQATAVALQALGEDVQTLIAGGFDRGIDYEVLGEAIAVSKIKNLILFPDTGEKIWKAVKNRIKNQESRIKEFQTEKMEEAVKIAFKSTNPGKIVLLSSASSSFNLFKDYNDRGTQFIDWVKQLGAG